MNCTEAHARLHDYVDDALTAAEFRALETHLDRCSVCRDALANLRALRAATTALPQEIAPGRDLWPGVERALLGARSRPASAPATGAPGKRSGLLFRWPARLALTAAALMIVVTLGWWSGRLKTAAETGWVVSPISGAPQVGAASIAGPARLRPGQWLETDGASRARLEVGTIGEVRLEPGSRLRLVDAAATHQRLELTRGTLHALIWSPPRLFFVDTPSATAIDLGCAYTLNVDGKGDGIVHVTAGFVALEHGSRTAVIPAGMMCAARRGAGPGTPFATDAPLELRRALERFDFEPAGDAAIDEIIGEARPGDTVTLWHLLSRVRADRRGDVFDKLAALHAPPEGVTRNGILRADAPMLARWAVELGLIAPGGAGHP